MADNIKVLSVTDTVKMAWGKVGGAKGTFWAVLFLIFILQAVLGYLNKQVDAGSGGFVTILVSIVFIVLQLLLSWGLIYLGILRAQDLPIQCGMIRYVFNLVLFLKMIGVYILEGLILGVVSLLLLTFPLLVSSDNPGSIVKLLDAICFVAWFTIFITLVIRMYLAKGIVIAQNLGPWVAIKKSFEITRGNVLPLIGITIVNLLILFISAIPFGIGLIWSLPFVFICYGVVYTQLINNR